MEKVTMKEYYEDLGKFICNHEDYNVDTTPLVDGVYRKTYASEDGATFFEVNRMITETVEVEVNGLVFNVNVKMLETEYWSTDDSDSKYVYSK